MQGTQACQQASMKESAVRVIKLDFNPNNLDTQIIA